jgi:hypothetical protein
VTAAEQILFAVNAFTALPSKSSGSAAAGARHKTGIAPLFSG